MKELIGWTDRRYIKLWHGRAPIALIAEALDLTPLEVAQVLREENKLGCDVRYKARWTADELDVLRRDYGIDDSESIGRRLGRTGKAVRRRACRMGLRQDSAAKSLATKRRKAESRRTYGRYSGLLSEDNPTKG